MLETFKQMDAKWILTSSNGAEKSKPTFKSQKNEFHVDVIQLGAIQCPPKFWNGWVQFKWFTWWDDAQTGN